jgi:hypothetical protein
MSRTFSRNLGEVQATLLNSLVESARQEAQPRAARYTRIFGSGGSKVLSLPPETALYLGNNPYLVVYHLEGRVFMELIPHSRKSKSKRNNPMKTEPAGDDTYVRVEP